MEETLKQNDFEVQKEKTEPNKKMSSSVNLLAKKVV